MENYRTDDEQAEAIKKWWRENGRAVVMGVVIGLAVVVGARYWVQYTKEQAQQASILYSQLEKSLAANNAESVLTTGQNLLNDYSSTAYAAMAALAMAKVQVDASKSDLAKDHLKWVIDKADDGIQHTARLRLARLLINDGKLQEASELISGIKSTGYATGYEELRADIALAQGNTLQATELYRLALAGSSGERREFLQMKIDNLPLTANVSGIK